jgi:hypothetical protein
VLDAFLPGLGRLVHTDFERNVSYEREVPFLCLHGDAEIGGPGYAGVDLQEVRSGKGPGRPGEGQSPRRKGPSLASVPDRAGMGPPISRTPVTPFAQGEEHSGPLGIPQAVDVHVPKAGYEVFAASVSGMRLFWNVNNLLEPTSRIFWPEMGTVISGDISTLDFDHRKCRRSRLFGPHTERLEWLQ